MPHDSEGIVARPTRGRRAIRTYSLVPLWLAALALLLRWRYTDGECRGRLSRRVEDVGQAEPTNASLVRVN